eukprot:6488651-Amphidinium_carterae.3
MCNIFDIDVAAIRKEGGMIIHCASPVCRDWSRQNQHRQGGMGPHVVAWAAWLGERVLRATQRAEDVIVTENVPAQDTAALLAPHLPNHHIMSFILDPCDFGLPSRRQRRYTIAIAPWAHKVEVPDTYFSECHTRLPLGSCQLFIQGCIENVSVQPVSSFQSHFFFSRRVTSYWHIQGNIDNREQILIYESSLVIFVRLRCARKMRHTMNKPMNIDILDSDEEDADHEVAKISVCFLADVTDPRSAFGCQVSEGMTGLFWYCAPAEYVQNELEYLRVQAKQPRPCPTECLLTRGDRKRLVEYKEYEARKAEHCEQTEAKGPRKRQRQQTHVHGSAAASSSALVGASSLSRSSGTAGAADAAVAGVSQHAHICDLKQTVAFAGGTSVYLPCLLARCDTVWSLAKERMLLPAEALFSQGFPVPVIASTSKRGTETKMPFPWSVAMQCKRSEIYSWAGNGLCVPVAGSVLMWTVLAFAVDKDVDIVE